MNFTEKKVDETYCFRGRIINTRVDNIVLPNGKPSIREVCWTTARRRCAAW